MVVSILYYQWAVQIEGYSSTRSVDNWFLTFEPKFMNLKNRENIIPTQGTTLKVAGVVDSNSLTA